MKKLLTILLGFVLMLSAVSAVNMVITPEYVHLDHTDSKVVDVCVNMSDGKPYKDLVLSITAECQDLNNDHVCGPSDLMYPAVFDAVVTSSPTNEFGCGQVTLSTFDAEGGSFAYRVNSENAEAEVDEEYGLAYVPEMGVIGAAVVLAGAGLFVMRKRKEN